MPLLAMLYTLILLIGIAESVWNHARYHDPAWFTALDLSADLGRAVLFVGYWLTELVVSISYGAPLLFFFSWVWGGVFGKRAVEPLLRRMKSGDWQSEQEKRVYTRIAILWVSAINFPAFWFGLKAAVRQL